jgi:RNA polymerase sigma-70 factor (ECF subfamily)
MQRSLFSSLFKRYYDDLYSTALRYVKVPEMAEDIVQQVFLRLWEKGDGIKEITHKLLLRPIGWRCA